MNHHKGFLFAGLGIFQFFVITILCMLLYTGGNLIDNDLKSYSFTLNFFSDLGRTRTFDDLPNTLIASLFTFTVSGAGLATLLFSVYFPKLFKGTNLHRLALVGTVFGVVSGICYIGVGFTPWDILFKPHVAFVKVGFLCFLLASIFMGTVMYKHKAYPRAYAWTYGLFMIILLGYLYVLFFGPKDITSERDVTINVIAQKIILYSQMATMLVQCYGAYQFSLKKGQK